MNRRSPLMCVALFLALLPATTVAAQEASTLPELDDLKAPPSPAFVILDIAPSKVERPQALRPLVVSAFSASGEGFPRNYSVEFSPYWLGTPQLTFDDYYKNDPLKNTVRQLSLSIGTTPIGKSPDLGTSLALGVRTLVFPGLPHPTLAALQKKLATQQRASLELQSILNPTAQLIKLLQQARATSVGGDEQILNNAPFKALVDKALSALIAEVETPKTEIDGLKRELKEDRLSETERKQKEARIEELETQLAQAIKQSGVAEAAAMLTAFQDSVLPYRISVEQALTALSTRLDEKFKADIGKSEAQLKATALAIQALDTQRVGFMLATAGAVSWDVPADITSGTTLAKFGVWITPGYRFVRCDKQGECSQPIDILGVFRYLDNQRINGDTTVELGGRLIWQPTAKLALSGEWLGQVAGGDSDDRLVGVVEYQFNDTAFLYASFGRDFAEKGTRRNLVSLVGITLGFGKKPIITPSE